MKLNTTIKKFGYGLSIACTILVIGLASCSDDDGPILSTENGLSLFSLAGVDREFTIDLATKTITNKVALPYGYNVSNLVAKFTIPKAAASVKVGAVDQVSGTTPNDFSQPVTYVVTAQDKKTTANFVVTVNVSASAWTKIATDPYVTLNKPSAFVHDSKLWVVGALETGEDKTVSPPVPGKYHEYVYSSTDGVTWATVHNNTLGSNDSIPLGTLAKTVSFGNKLVNVGGAGAPFLQWGVLISRPSLGVSTSSDGSTWTSTTLANAGLPSAVANPHILEKEGTLYLLGYQSASFGAAQAVFNFNTYKSTDGTTWTALGTKVLDGIKITPSPPTFYASTLFNGDMYVAGGISGAAFLTNTIANYSKSVYKSTDGLTWTVASADGFPQVAGSQIVAYKGKLYAIAGASTNGTSAVYKKDVYVSEDGATWTLATGGLVLPADFSPRAFHQVVVLKDKIYIIGGENGEGSVRDVWAGEFVN